MKNKTLMILLGIIAVNLTIQTVKDVGLFPTAYAQNDSLAYPEDTSAMTDAELLAYFQAVENAQDDAYADNLALQGQSDELRDFINARIESLRDDLIFFTRNIQVITW